MNDILNRKHDSLFNKIEHLTWYPWVGKEYEDAAYKVLIIGESQYATDENGEYDEDTGKHFRENKDTTREYVYNTIELKDAPAKFYMSLLRTFGVSNDNLFSFWSKVSYYHFFQMPDESVSGNTHLKKERFEAWNRWLEIIEVLQPHICIFCGTGLRGFYKEWNDMNGRNTEWWDVQSGFYDAGQQPIRGNYHIDPSHTVELLFIKHPSSRGFSSEQWNKFLGQQFPEAMEWLNNKQQDMIFTTEYPYIDGKAIAWVKPPCLVDQMIVANEKCGLINENSEFIILPEYDNMQYLGGEYVAVNIGFEEYETYQESGVWGVIDLNSNYLIPLKYTDIYCWMGYKMFAVEFDGKWGVISIDNELVIPFEYDWISWPDEYGLIKVCKDNEEICLDIKDIRFRPFL